MPVGGEIRPVPQAGDAGGLRLPKQIQQDLLSLAREKIACSFHSRPIIQIDVWRGPRGRACRDEPLGVPRC